MVRSLVIIGAVFAGMIYATGASPGDVMDALWHIARDLSRATIVSGF